METAENTIESTEEGDAVSMSPSTSLLDCPDCGGLGWVEGTGMAHHPSCDGSCRNCPIPVQTQETCAMCGGSGQVESNASLSGVESAAGRKP